MNDISVFIYLLCFAAVFGMTCVYMAMMMRSTLSEFDNFHVSACSRPPEPTTKTLTNNYPTEF